MISEVSDQDDSWHRFLGSAFKGTVRMLWPPNLYPHCQLCIVGSSSP